MTCHFPFATFIANTLVSIHQLNPKPNHPTPHHRGRGGPRPWGGRGGTWNLEHIYTNIFRVIIRYFWPTAMLLITLPPFHINTYIGYLFYPKTNEHLGMTSTIRHKVVYFRGFLDVHDHGTSGVLTCHFIILLFAGICLLLGFPDALIGCNFKVMIWCAVRVVVSSVSKYFKVCQENLLGDRCFS